MAMQDRKCDLCGDEFTPTGSKQRICTKDHQIPCKYDKCENTFSYVRRKEFCGFKCGRLYQIENAPIRTVECIECGVEFETNVNGKGYCKDMHERACVICGGEFVRKMPSKVMTCSKACQKIKTEQTNLETHGVRNQFQREDVKEKIAELRTDEESARRLEKAKATNRERYGADNAMQSPEVLARARETNLERYGVENVMHSPEIMERMKSTNLDRYGVPYTFQAETVKERIRESVQERYGVDYAAAAPEIVAARKQTSLERYGHENPGGTPEVQEKIRQTNMERYGVEHSFQAEVVKDKIRVSILDIYGVDNPAKSPIVQEKMAMTNLERYGVRNVLSSPQVQQKIRKYWQDNYGVDNPSQLSRTKEKIKATTLERFGVESIFQLPENQLKASENNKYRISKLNRKWKDLLKAELGIEFELEVPFTVDGKTHYADLGYKNILIDVNPTVSHNSSIPFPHIVGRCSQKDVCEKHLPRDPNYHQARALAAESVGLQLLQCFDWVNPDIFLSIVRSKLFLDSTKVYAKKTQVKRIKQPVANRFFEENHLMGKSNKQTFCVGLYYNDELVHVQSYGPARMSNKAEWEAIRSCSKMGYQVVGGFSKCDKFFFDSVDPQSVVSYVDLSISQGATDSQFDGWNLVRTNRPGATWVNIMNSKSPRFIRDSTARRVGADRLLGMEMGEKYPMTHDDGSKVTNEFVLLSEGYVQVYDAGTRTYMWSRP